MVPHSPRLQGERRTYPVFAAECSLTSPEDMLRPFGAPLAVPLAWSIQRPSAFWIVVESIFFFMKKGVFLLPVSRDVALLARNAFVVLRVAGGGCKLAPRVCSDDSFRFVAYQLDYWDVSLNGKHLATAHLQDVGSRRCCCAMMLSYLSAGAYAPHLRFDHPLPNLFTLVLSLSLTLVLSPPCNSTFSSTPQRSSVDSSHYLRRPSLQRVQQHDYNRSGDSLGHGHGAADMVQSLQSMLLTSEQNGIMRLPNYGCFMHQQVCIKHAPDSTFVGARCCFSGPHRGR